MATPQNIRSFRVRGLCDAPATPFKANGDVNLELIPQYIQHLLDFGVPNAFVTGTNGEGLSLTVEERKSVAEAWVKAGKGKLRAIIFQIGAENVRDSQELARHAQEVGVDAIACVGPTYFKPKRTEEYVEYMRQVASAAPKLPFYLYDIDFFTGITLDVNEFFHLGKTCIPTLTGVKHTSPNFVSMNKVLVDHNGEFQVLLGSPELYLQALSIGMDVTVMNSYNGHVLNRLKEAFDRGDLVSARKEQARVIKMGEVRRKYGFNIPDGTKAVMFILGMDMGQARIPCKSVTSEEIEQVRQDMVNMGFFEWGTQRHPTPTARM